MLVHRMISIINHYRFYIIHDLILIIIIIIFLINIIIIIIAIIINFKLILIKVPKV